MKGIALGVVTADCVPIILFDIKNNIIGCIHAGWKGAFSDIIKNTINQIRKISSNNLIYACVGPCIGKKSYEVDLIFYEKFIRKSKKNRKYFSDKGKIKKFFNLRKYVTDKLLKLKVKKRFPNSVSIFLLPPNKKELENRIRKRGTDSEESIIKRLERANFEMSVSKDFDFVFKNYNVEKTVKEILEIIE